MKKRQGGQALVLVLLSLSVVLTLVLFILSRSITDIAVSSKNEESVRAFSAAEAGIEQSLVIGTGVDTTTIGNASYSSSVSSYAKGSQEYVYPVEMAAGDTALVWLVEHDSLTGRILCDATHLCFTGNTLKICWGKLGTSSTASTTPAIEASTFFESTPNDVATIAIARSAFDPFAARVPANGFASTDAGTCTIGGTNFQFQKTILFSSYASPAIPYSSAGGLQFVKIRMLYNSDTSHSVGISVNFAGNSVLPSQGQAIDSTGVAGQSNRKISVFQGWPETPSVFDNAIYSSTGLVK